MGIGGESRRNLLPVVEAAEHDLDAVASPVAVLVVLDGIVAGSVTGNARFKAVRLKRVQESVGVVGILSFKRHCVVACLLHFDGSVRCGSFRGCCVIMELKARHNVLGMKGKIAISTIAI